MKFHASDRKMFFAAPYLLSAVDDSAPKEVQVLKVGSFKHPVYGDVKITSEDLKAFKENFDKGVRKTRIPFNYEHGQSSAHGTKAAGWIKSLSLKSDGQELWAEPEWTPQASQGIKDKEWQYSSAEINPKWTDPETGVVHKSVLTGVALTNVPFIKGMQTIAAHEQSEGKPAMEFNEIVALLLSKHGINLTSLQAQAGLVVGLQDQVKSLSDEAAKVKGLAAEVVALTAKVELSEKAASEAKFGALVEKGMKEGKLTKAFAEGSFRKAFEANGLAFAETMLAEMPKTVPTGGAAGHGGAGPEGGQKFSDSSEEMMAEANKVMAADKCSFSEAVSKVRKANPALAKRYDAGDGMAGGPAPKDD